MPRHRVIVVKCGGVVMTDKAAHRSLRPDQLALCAAFVHRLAVQCAEVDMPTDLVFVHGAGSFAHFEAMRAALTQRANPTVLNDERIAALREGVEGLAMLSRSVVDALLTAAAPSNNAAAVQVMPTVFNVFELGVGASVEEAVVASKQEVSRRSYDVCCANRMAVNGPDIVSARQTVRTVSLPVSHGSFVLGGDRRCDVVSGDHLVQHVACHWIDRQRECEEEAQRAGLAVGTSFAGLDVLCVFLTDVAGVYTADPRVDPDARLVRCISAASISSRVATCAESGRSKADEERAAPLVAAGRVDVSGMMDTKLACAAAVVQYADRVAREFRSAFHVNADVVRARARVVGIDALRSATAMHELVEQLVTSDAVFNATAERFADICGDESACAGTVIL